MRDEDTASFSSLIPHPSSLIPLLRGDSMLRTRRCGELSAADIGQEVTLNGWVRVRRDHGQLIFLDLWDHSGLVQTVFDPAADAYRVADACRSEYVVAVKGRVARRLPGAENPKLATGEIE